MYCPMTDVQYGWRAVLGLGFYAHIMNMHGVWTFSSVASVHFTLYKGIFHGAGQYPRPSPGYFPTSDYLVRRFNLPLD